MSAQGLLALVLSFVALVLLGSWYFIGRRLRRLHVFENETDKVVAFSEEDAWLVWCKNTGEKRADHEEYWSWERIPDGFEFSIMFEEGDPNPEMYAGLERESLSRKPYYSFRCRTTARDWAQRAGRGFLCSTEF